jgi:hypothetical protein
MRALCGLMSLVASSAAAKVVQPIDLLNDHGHSVVRIVTVNKAGQTRVGCGIVLSDSGTIATAYALVSDVTGARVELANGTRVDQVRLLATDGVIALLDIDAPSLRPLRLADSSRLEKGASAWAVILGGPNAGRLLVGGALESSTRVALSASDPRVVVQLLLNASLFVENWGGPVFTDQGDAVGIVTPRVGPDADTFRQGVIPSNSIRALYATVTSGKTSGTALPPLPSPAAAPGRATSRSLANARTLALLVAFGPSRLEAEIKSGIETAFPWKVVDGDRPADLVLVIAAMEKTTARYRYINGVRDDRPIERSMKYEVGASLRDTGTHEEVWSSQKSVDAAAATPYDQVASRIVTAMQKSLGRVTPATPEPSPATGAPVGPPASFSLAVADLPPGFRALSAAEIQQLGMTAESQAVSLRNLSEGATVTSHAVFADPARAHFVLVSTIGPVSTLAAAGIHLQMTYPEAMIRSMNEKKPGGGTANGTATVLLPGLDRFGDRSIGFSNVSAGSPVSLREDVVLAIRGDTFENIHSIYPSGTQPAISIADLANIVDTKVRAARGDTAAR